jgi:hypothetical protein
MSMLFMDGFDYLVAANQTLKWTSGGIAAVVGGVYGKGSAVRGATLIKTFVSSYASGMVGFHYNPGTQALGLTQVVQFNDSGTAQVDLRFNSAGQLFFTRNGTTIGNTTTFFIQSNVWYWIEVQVVISTTVGQANLYINGVSFLSQSGLNTQNTGNATFNQTEIIVNANQAQIFDSFHCWNTVSGFNGDVAQFPYGEHIIDTELANAVGSNTTWNRGGTNTGNNYSQVNEANEDGDTTYVYMSSSGAGDIDSYGWAILLESSGNIGALAINTIARIDDAGPHVFENYTLSSGSSALSSGQSPSSTYLNFQTFQNLDPHTSLLWTIAGRNAAQFGYEFIS